jgi:hypothetical protein
MKEIVVSPQIPELIGHIEIDGRQIEVWRSSKKMTNDALEIRRKYPGYHPEELSPPPQGWEFLQSPLVIP